MRKLILSCVVALAMPLSVLAQGWPAHYGGVMLQGFFWDSYNETNWTELTNQADELSKYFDLIWVPNSGTTSSYAHKSNYNTMGYDPCYWLQHNSSFGTEEELRKMIATYKAKGTGIIEDVVINHKNGLNDWCDFPEETVTGQKTGKEYKLTWSMADICKDDECANPNGHEPFYPTGNEDTGDNFDGFRDLDHTSGNVQHNVDVYLDFLLNELGYAGFRYDMVKGYGAEYIKIYNEASQPQFSVGEYWDSKENVAKWIRGTQFTSAAFDFGLKFAINSYFGGSNWDIADKGNAADESLSRYAVTFVDNHDTYRDNNKLGNNVLAANAFILALPGTPCIFWPHWEAYKTELGKMIEARKTAGVTNTSKIIRQQTYGGGYITEVEGDSRNILCVSGYIADLGDVIKDYELVSSGTADNPNYAFYISKEKIAHADNGITLYVHASNAPRLYVWEKVNNQDVQLNGDWNNCRWMSDVSFIGADKYYHQTFHPQSGSLNFILRSNTQQTPNIEGVTSNVFYTYDNATTATDNTSEMTGKKLKAIPSYNGDEVCAFFEASATDYNNVKAWAWDEATNYTGGTWPGAQCTWLADLPNGNKLWKWTCTTTDSQPAQILFNNDGNGKQTGNFNFVNGGYYNADGLYTLAEPVINNELVESIPLREFTASQFATLCLPYDVTSAELEAAGGKFYKYSSETEGVLYFSETEALHAWNPYVYIASETGENLKNLADKPVVGGRPLAVTHGNFTFVGTSTDKTLVSNDATTYYGYKQADGTFVKVGTTKGAKIGAWKCYFTTPTAKAAQAKRSVFDGMTTNINEVKTILSNTPKAIYTIEGKKVAGNKLPKGLYIYNGKKLIIR